MLTRRKSSRLQAKVGSVFIIAEVGINHNGDLTLAIEHVREAARAGADAVKFQNWVADDFISDRTRSFTYISRGCEITESFYELCKRNEMGRNWLPELKRVADECGIALMSTPTSRGGVDELNEVGIRVLKNGSDYLSHIPLISYMAEKADVLILSTGMATEQDVDYAVDAAWSSNEKCELVLLHCTSVYPTPPEEANLLRMVALARKYGKPVGYSDHTRGYEAAVQAVTLGACVLEKHFTLSHDLEGPDHWFSVDPGELAAYVNAVREAEARLGAGALILAPSEHAIAREQRLSAVARKTLLPGEVLDEDSVAYRKPGYGIPPVEIKGYLGRKIKHRIEENKLLMKEDFY